MTVIVIGDRTLQRRFRTMARRMGNRLVLFKRIGIMLLKEIDKTFKEETHEGKAWSPLSEATKAKPGRGGESAEILKDTRQLQRSYVMKPGRNQVAVGTPTPYSKIHEEGTERIPQRKMLPSKKRGLEIALDTTKGFVKTNVSRAKR